MAVILGVVFLCLVHWSQPLNQYQKASESVWVPSHLSRFTKPPVINRPIPLLYGTQSRSAIIESSSQRSNLRTRTVFSPQVTTTPAYLHPTNSWLIVTSPPRRPSNTPEIFSNPLRISSNPSISSSNSSNIISNSPLIVSNSNILLNLWNILLNTTILPLGYSNVLSNSSVISSDSPLITSNSFNVALNSSGVLPVLNTSQSIIQNSSNVLPVLNTSRSVISNSSNVIANSSVSLPSSLQHKFCNPMAPPSCVDVKFGFCIDDEEYPMEDIEVATEFSKLTDQFSYKLTLAEEKPSLLVNNTNDDLNVGNVCLSLTVTMKPLRARNLEGDWRVIVQDVRDIIQRQQMSICSSPDTGCQNPDHFSRAFCFNGKCNQKFVVQKFLAFDPCNPDRDVFVDSFKMQSECNCRISRSPCPVYRYDV